jgi:hypothetical protein
MDWYPAKPAIWQVALGVVFFMAIAGVALYWSADEVGGNRIFLWLLAGLAVVMAGWRTWIAISLLRHDRFQSRLRS